MKLTRLKHYICRAVEVGPLQTISVIKNRGQARLFDWYWKRLALAGRAHHKWSQVADVFHFSQNFSEWMMLFKKRALSLTVLKNSLVTAYDEKNYAENLIAAVSYTFDLLGSGPITYEKGTIPWHEDFRLKNRCAAADCVFDGTIFYQDIRVNVGTDWEEKKDIKIPWELSRLQHFFVLASVCHDSQDAAYWIIIEEQLLDWIENNPYLLGPNWVCPMDVGLRAVNIIWALVLCAKHIENRASFEIIITTLYDHFFYLEHHWEIYDGRTSNHYLSDLIGYLYCCWLFKDGLAVKNKVIWCFQQIEAEMHKQVFPEGSSYEGSTNYQRLVTELFYHAQLLAPLLEYELSPLYQERLKKMGLFLGWCSYSPNKLVSIGDNDSGRVVRGIDEQMLGFNSSLISGKQDFTDFGLSIIKTDRWHITVRQHAYQRRQPSGHFHNDVGSVTVAYEGQPIFIDPGSYLYTASGAWRNLFRSSLMHSTFGIKNHEAVLLDERLFALDIPEHQWQPTSNCNNDMNLTMYHDLYSVLGLRAYRSVELDEEKNELIVVDWWESIGQKPLVPSLTTWWRYILAPTIAVKSSALDSELVLQVTGSTQMQLHFSGNLFFRPESCSISQAYGSKTESTLLHAQEALQLHQKNRVVLRLKK